MTITITHPETHTRRIRNTMLAAVVALAAGASAYAVIRIAADRESRPPANTPAVETSTFSEAFRVPAVETSTFSEAFRVHR